MAVPKKRTSTRRKGLRRAGHTHKPYADSATMICPNCQTLTLRHRACPNCGHYRGREIVSMPAQEEDEGSEET